MSKLDEFNDYHAKNPQVYKMFEKFSLVACQHRKNFGAKVIIERIRWDTMIAGDDGFKVNNNHAPYYARLFEQLNPQYKGFFRKRKADGDDGIIYE